MAVNVVMGVDISGFNNGIKQGQSILKGLNAEMKAADAAFKATGNAEQQLTAKTKTLTSQLQVQKGIADQAEQAMQKLAAAGIAPTNAEYQRLYATMVNAQAGMNEAQAALNALSGSAQEAAGSADQLTESVQGIGKKISLDQVISGIDRITSGLERAAKKAIQLGEDLWNTIMDSARWADDTATLADNYGVPLERFLKMQRLASSEMETSVEAMLGAQDKFNKNVGKGVDATIQALKDLKINRRKLLGDEGVGEYAAKDSVELFWEAGRALFNMSDAFDKEATAQALFGKSWRELSSLFENYKNLEEYNKALDEMTVNDEETVRDLSALNDAVTQLEDSWKVLKNQVLGELAPALTKGADAISGLLDTLTNYLKTDEGQKMLNGLGDAIDSLFEDLGKINTKDVVENFTNIFNGLVSSLQWIVRNKNELISALEAVVAGWGGLKITGGILTIVKMIDGLRELGILGGGSAAGAATGLSGAGAAGGTGATFWDKIVQFTNGFLMNNAAAVGDWITHESSLGPVFQGQETLGGWFSRTMSEIRDRAATFVNDWVNNPLISMWNNFGMNQDAATRLPEGADWRPSYMKDQQPVVEMEPVVPADAAETIIDQVGETELPVTLTSQTSAADVANQVGPVPLTGTIQVFGFGGFGGGTFDFIKGHANGLPYVPQDRMLALLHKGEQVVPAREVQSRSFNSNLYVESMYMNNGTDAAGLASAMAAAQQRMMSGFGSC